jgi:hypothetical protein
MYFICPPDVDGVESEPLLGSAGIDPDACWTTLHNNRQRETGDTETLSDLKRRLLAQGYCVHPYTLEPIEPVRTPEVEAATTTNPAPTSLASVLNTLLAEPVPYESEEEEENELDEDEGEEEEENDE